MFTPSPSEIYPKITHIYHVTLLTKQKKCIKCMELKIWNEVVPEKIKNYLS